MSTYTQIYYHIVFSTKEREPVLKADRRQDLFGYVWGILKNKQGHLYRINGVEDHVHIFSSLHPMVSLANLVKEIKTSSSQWIKERRVFPSFSHWQDGYAAFTHCHKERDAVIEYIKTQEEHHRRTTFRDELQRLPVEAGVEFDEKYLL